MSDYYKNGFDRGYGRNNRDPEDYPSSSGDIASYESGHRNGVLRKKISEDYDHEEVYDRYDHDW